MKICSDKIESIFEFTGLWGIPSKCGIKRISFPGKEIFIVTELYKDNPGTSITQVTISLATQICERYNIEPKNIIYIEHAPDMNSKLTFYKDNYYLVQFDIEEEKLTNPGYKELDENALNNYLKGKSNL